MPTTVTYGDLAREPGAVARELVAWERGDPGEAVVQTLAASAAELTNTRYVLWIWAGRTPAGEPAWALPVPVRTIVSFAPKAPATLLLQVLETAVALDAVPGRLRLEDWRGFGCLVAPGVVDGELAAALLADSFPPPGRARLAALPADVPLGGEPLPLPAPEGPRGGPLGALAGALGVHPVRVALALIARGLTPSLLPRDPRPFVALAREWGLTREPEPEPAPPSLAIADDPCPRRRHARVVLQRLLRIGKVGAGYHTDIANFARGAAAHERHEALEVAEALLRAGLLGEKPSVGQRHIYLNREALPEIHALIDRGETRDARLAALWTAPAPGDAPTGPPAPSP